MQEERTDKPPPLERPPGPARLFALLAGVMLSLLGVLGFFYDAGFGTGTSLASDDLAGILNVNGWRNVVYLVSGLTALLLAPRRPRTVALALGCFYLAFALWGFDATERGIGSILDLLPLGDNDNALHLVLGTLGVGAASIDGPLPALPKRFRREKREGGNPRPPRKRATGARAARRRSPAGPRRDDAAEPQ